MFVFGYFFDYGGWMADEPKEPVVEEHVDNQAGRVWEEEARRTAAELGGAAREPDSDEAHMIRTLDANLEEFSKQWVWSPLRMRWI